MTESVTEGVRLGRDAIFLTCHRELLTTKPVSASDADLIFQSSDNVLFKVHRTNLSVHSHVFPGKEVTDDGEPVPLEENAEVLELLLLHIYPDPAPDMDKKNFTTICALAEAAEKYQLTSAMEICRLHLKNRYKEDPAAVLQYACKHGYLTLADLCAKYTLDWLPQNVLSLLGPYDFARWAIYREHWVKVRTYLHARLFDISANVACNPGIRHQRGCEERARHAHYYLASSVSRTNSQPPLLSLFDVPQMLAPVFVGAGTCGTCSVHWNNLEPEFVGAVGAIPEFSTVTLN